MSVPHVVLRYLKKGPAHGYGLHKDVAQLRHYYPLSNVNIYSVLRELEQLGWAESVSQIHGSRVRRVYRITDAGEQELTDWFRRPPEDDRFTSKDPIALKLLMLSIDESVDLSWLESSLRELDEDIERTREQLDRSAGRSPLVILTLQWQDDAYTRRREFLVDALRIGRAHRQAGEPGSARKPALGYSRDAVHSRLTRRDDAP